MKNHRFPWLRNRTTDNRKCEKARNIKEKRTIEMFSTASKQLVALRSSQRDNYFTRTYNLFTNPEKFWFFGVFLCFLTVDNHILSKYNGQYTSCVAY